MWSGVEILEMDGNALIIALIVLICCIFFKWQYSYWARKQVEGPPPLPIFGNYFECVFMQKHFSDIIDEIYSLFPKARYIGFYKYHIPCLLTRDLKLINRILASDLISNFETDSSGYENLYLMWKQNVLRQETRRSRSMVKEIKTYYGKEKFTENFSSLMNTCERLVNYIDETSTIAEIEGIEMKDLSTKFTIEAATETAFGIKSNCFEHSASIYLELYKKYFTSGSLEHCLSFVKKLLWQQTVEQQVTATLKEVIKQRILSSQRKQADLLDDFMSRSYDVNDNNVIIDLVLGLQEAFECTSTLVTYSLYELASSDDIQSKVQNEIKEVLYLNEGVLNEKVLRKLPYLDSLLFETLRLHSHVFILTRKCIKEHVLPAQFDDSAKEIVIERGTPVIVPVYSIHLDSNNYAEPYKFQPERYLRATDKPILYPFPNFGRDSQFCLRHEYAFMKAKLVIATLMLKYSVTLSTKTRRPPDLSKKTFNLYCEDGIWLKFNRRT